MSFNSNSPWNTSIGSKAQYGDVSHPMTQELLGCTGGSIKDAAQAHAASLQVDIDEAVRVLTHSA